MTALLLTARLLLAAVFLMSGATKLAAPCQHRSLRDLFPNGA